MATHPIGSRSQEIIYIECEAVSLTLKGSISSMPTASLSDREVSSVKVVAEGSFDMHICEVCVLQQEVGSGMVYQNTPLFLEQRNYELIIEADSCDGIEFWHENKNIRDKVTITGKRNRMMTGVLNFGNEVGYSDLIVKVDSRDYLVLRIEVFPSKINYKTDYLDLMNDVTSEVYSLAFDFLKKTYHQAELTNRQGNSPTEFFSIIRMIFDKMIIASDIVITHPHHRLESRREVVKAHKCRRTDARTVKWLNKHASAVQREASGRIRTEKVEAVYRQASYDTHENRFVKAVLLNTIRRLESLKGRYKEVTEYRRKRDLSVLNEIEKMQKELNRRVEFTFLKEVGSFGVQNSMSLVFAMAPGYKELYRYYMMLQKSLSLHGSVFNISLKDVSQLYEYWCFIKLNSFLKDRYRLVKQDVLRTDNSGLYVSLVKGKSSSVRYENRLNGERIELKYNPTYNKGNSKNQIPTLTQKPDNVLELTKNDGRFGYIFDAKYRINMAKAGSGYRSKYELPGPEESDINTMHRYRDALVYKNEKDATAYDRTMFGAYVLFPYGEEEVYQNHHFYKSIDEVNIGGLPFLPSANTLVKSFLDELIRDSEMSAFERATLPKGIESRLKEVDLSVRDTLVGFLGSKNQLDVCLEDEFYYIPVKYVSKTRLPLKYVAIQQSKNLFGDEAGIRYYGEIKHISIVKRASITEVPIRRAGSANDDYYRIEVMSWNQLDNDIRRGAGSDGIVNYYTNHDLLLTSKSTTELAFTSMEQLRLYHELQRLTDDVKVDGNEQKVNGFEFNGSYIYLRDGELFVHSKGGRQWVIPMDRYTQKTRNVYRKIVSAVDAT